MSRIIDGPSVWGRSGVRVGLKWNYLLAEFFSLTLKLCALTITALPNFFQPCRSRQRLVKSYKSLPKMIALLVHTY
jgi:hypothetical protein